MRPINNNNNNINTLIPNRIKNLIDNINNTNNHHYFNIINNDDNYNINNNNYYVNNRFIPDVNSINHILQCLQDICKYVKELQQEIFTLNNKIYELNQQQCNPPTIYQNDQSNLCSVCMDEEKDHAFVVCGHLCVCRNCAQQCNGKCPICRSNSNYMRIIIS